MSRHGKTMGAALSVAMMGLIILMSATGHGAGKKSRGGGASLPPPLPPVRVTLPPVETHTADNGLRLYYIKDELPQLTIVVSIGYGKLNENKDNAGIAELLARTLTLAGSKKYPGEKLSAAIERVGGRFTIQESWENTVITIRVLERHSGLAYDILGDLVKNPNFDISYLNQARSLMDEKIRRRSDNPAELAFVMLRKIIFGGDGYGAVAVERSVASITLNDLAEVWKTRVKARNIMVGIAGSPDYDTVRKSILDTLGDLEPGVEAGYAVDRPKALAAVRSSRKKIYFIPRPIPQATIVVGTVAPDIRSPQVYP
ncbi:MAG TPA: insulinase family protein, partial [Spirochaetes bacterium]|nr:insulinase family protein [Spirochaetota bacterium]